MSESTRIGLGSCPVCASQKAHYTLSKKLLVCVTCNSCNFQGFARSERSDEILRGHIKPATPPAEVSQLTPVAAAVAEVAASSSPGEPPAADPPPVTEKTKRGSLMSW